MLKQTPTRIVSKELADSVFTTLKEKSAQDIILIDLENKSDIADFMIIASGNNTRHVSALADYAAETLKEAGSYIFSVDGKEEGTWALVDSADVLVHIFHPEARQTYNLEKMWLPDFEQSGVVQFVN